MCLRAGCPLMPFLPAPCSLSLACDGNFLPLPAYIWSSSYFLPAWLTLFLWWAPCLCWTACSGQELLGKGGSFSVPQAPVWERSPSLLLLWVKQIKRRYPQDFFLSASMNCSGFFCFCCHNLHCSVEICWR